MTKKYFSYHWDEGLEFWETEEQARQHTKSMIDSDIEDQGGVDEDLLNIFWGRVMERVIIEATGELVEFEGETLDEVSVELKPV